MWPKKRIIISVSFNFFLSVFATFVEGSVLCGSNFEDVASRTLLSPIVFHGRFLKVHNWTLIDEDGVKHLFYNTTFEVVEVFKGHLPMRDNEEKYRDIVVGVFADKADKERCVSPKLSLGLYYVVFINSTVYGKVGRQNVYRITTFPEMVLKQTVEVVRNYSSCKKSCGRKPTSNIEAVTDINTTVGQKLQFRCNARGRPNPVVIWSKDGSFLEPSKHLKVNHNRLQIGELKEGDSGVYGCHAVNILGQSKWSKLEVKVSSKKHSYPCANDDYCRNNGRCFMFQTLAVRFCQCADNFEGERCERKIVGIDDAVTGENDGMQLNMRFIISVIVVVIGAVVLVTIAVLSYFAIRKCYVYHKKKQPEKLKSLSKNYYPDETLQINKREEKSSGDEVDNPHHVTEVSINKSTPVRSGSTNSTGRQRLDALSSTPPELENRHRIQKSSARNEINKPEIKKLPYSAIAELAGDEEVGNESKILDSNTAKDHHEIHSRNTKVTTEAITKKDEFSMDGQDILNSHVISEKKYFSNENNTDAILENNNIPVQHQSEFTENSRNSLYDNCWPGATMLSEKSECDSKILTVIKDSQPSVHLTENRTKS